MQKRKISRGGTLGRVLAAAAVALGLVLGAPTSARAASAEYQLYPSPQSVEYADGSLILRDSANMVVEEGIDADTKARLTEALELKGIEPKESAEVSQSPRTLNVLVGIDGSKGAVDTYAQQLASNGDLQLASGLFDKTDAYALYVSAGEGGADTIMVLGRDTDSAFYGLTTLYQILQQVNGLQVRNMTLCDYADVVSRGFIEGFYGNPWSTADRVNLMEWSGYYKLNAYVYAPKDDPKHRSNWRDLYTADEVEQQLKPQAEAGNRSKCRFVYALAPFHSDWSARYPFRFDTEEHYQEDMADLKAKYLQTIDAGVRQIALLADDSTNWADQYGEEATYLRILNDLTDWIHELQAMENSDGTPKYEGLKDTILYCPALYTYTGAGESWYNDMPDNVQIVMTGGRTFGIANHDFAERFKANAGRAPFMWINWPCSDMARNFNYDWLTMGGHNNFLKSDVVPGDLDGIMLNPMQQSEPSKQGIFMAADYAWNLWESPEEGDQAWMDSFSYIEHNSPVANAASDGLRDMSANMRVHVDNNLDGPINDPDHDNSKRWWKNQESEYEIAGLDILSTLTEAKARFDNGTATAEDLQNVEKIYAALGSAAANYRAGAGDEALFAQMEPFVGSWDDTSKAALGYIEAVRLAQAGNEVEARTALSAADEAYDASQNGHKLDYLGSMKNARVGMVVVTPALGSLKSFAAGEVGGGSTPQPSGVTVTHDNQLVSQYGQHDGEPAVADGDESTFCWYQAYVGDQTVEGASVTVTYDTPRRAKGALFVQAARKADGKGDFIDQGTFEYQDAAGAWHEIGAIDGDQKQEFTFDEPVDVKALRVTNTKTKPVWWQVYEIGIVEAAAEPGDPAELIEQIEAAEAVTDEVKATWTTGAREAFDAALAAAREGVEQAEDLSQPELDALAAALAKACEGVERYTGMTLEELRETLRAPEGYTAATYAAYEQAFRAFESALEQADDLSAADGEALKAALDAATDALAFDQTARDEALLAWNDAEQFVENDKQYTQESHDAFMAAYNELGSTLEGDPEGKLAPGTYADLAAKLAAAIEGLKPYVEPEPEPEPETFTVTFVDRIPGNKDATFTVKEGEKLAAPEDPVLEGWEFKGWFTDGHEGGFKDKWDFDVDVVTSDLTLTAQWEKVDGPDKPVDPDKPGTDDPDKPIDPDKPAGPNDPSNQDGDGNNGGKPDADLPQTGDSTTVVMLGATAAAVACGASGMYLRRRNEQ